MTAIRLLLISLLLAMTTTSFASDYTVTNVYDGDTVEISSAGGRFKLRLTDIDAPERNQPYGKKSRSALTKLCKGKKISVHVQIFGTDKYNRNLGNLQCNRVDASLYLVDHGFAWHNAKYSNNFITKNAELKARQNKLGLWKNKKPIAPWVWRHQHPHA